MRTSTRKSLLIAGSYAAVLIVGMIMGPKFAAEDQNRRNGTFLPFFNGRADKLTSVLKLVDDRYVDKLASDSLKELAINEILTHLDPHTTYLPPDEAKMLTEDLEGNFFGIGIEYFILKDTITVTAVNPDGPASRAGLLKGDQIVSIDHKKVSHTNITAKQVVNLMRGKRGTSVQLAVKRGSQMLVKKIERDRITVSSISAAYLINKDAGYIKIDRFGARTGEDFTAALRKLQRKGMKNLILDLRGNGGGYLSAATSLADHFLPDKKLILYTQGAHEPRTDYFATAEGDFETGKLFVLIDENSASASEIVAGAVQDLDRGIIIGRRSFGKGLVQEQFDFGDGSALNLTIARYYTPSGRSIQKSYKEGKERYFDELHQRYTDGEVVAEQVKTMQLDKKDSYKTSSGKDVYGGGGIMPDIYIPLDTSAYTAFYKELYSTGAVSEYVYNNLVKQLKPASMDQFMTDFSVSEKQFQHLLNLAHVKKVRYSEAEVALSREEIRRNLKALAAQYFFGDEGYFRVTNSSDPAIQKALAELK